MKIYLLLFLLATNSAHSYMSDDSNFEIVPLHDHEVRRPGLGGGEIGNGAPYGGDDLDCQDPRSYENCYDVVQTFIVRSLEAARQTVSNPKVVDSDYVKARTSLYSTIRTSITLLKNYSESGGILLPYLEKGLEYNNHFNGACLNANNSYECNAQESKAAYQFLSAYLHILLDKVYGFDLQFFLPFSAGICGYAPEGTYTAFNGYLSRFMELQRELLALVNNVRVSNMDSPVNFQIPFYEAKLTSVVMADVGRDIQKFYIFSVFYRGLSVLDLLSAADNLSQQANLKSYLSDSFTAELKKARTAINEFNRTTSGYLYSSDTRVDCSRRK